MKQFEKMGWIRQGFLGLIVCAVISPSHAMTVRERYLLQNPQFAAHQAAEKTASPTKVVKHTRKHHIVAKETPVRPKETTRHHAKVAQPIEKHARGLQTKSRHQRVIMPKHTKSKFDQQQARDAQAALKHRSVKVKQAPIAKHHVRKASAKHVTHHVAKPVPKHHRKHHRAG